MAKNSWLMPAAIGLLAGWFFSGTLSKILNPIGSHFGITGGHVGYSYPAAAVSPSHSYSQPTFERRSFDRSYSSWLENTVNSTPAIG